MLLKVSINRFVQDKFMKCSKNKFILRILLVFVKIAQGVRNRNFVALRINSDIYSNAATLIDFKFLTN